MSEPMVKLSILFLFLQKCSHALVCSSVGCYGTMQEIVTPQVASNLNYFVKPDNFTDTCLQSNCVEALIVGKRFNCGINTQSFLDVDMPWEIPVGVHLRPSCSERQSLVRTSTSRMSQHVADLAAVAKGIAQSGYSPCSVVKMSHTNCSIESFTPDNKVCADNLEFTRPSPSMFLASISTLTSRPVLSNLKIADIDAKSGYTILHLGSQLTDNQEVFCENVTLSDMHNETIQLDFITGSINIISVAEIIENLIPGHDSQFTYANISHISKPILQSSLSQIIALKETSKALCREIHVSEICHTNTLYTVSIPLFFGMLLLCTCLWKCCHVEHEIKNQTNKKK